MRKVSMKKTQIIHDGIYMEEVLEMPEFPKDLGDDRPTWTSKDGRVQFIDEMETSHLRNIMSMLGKNTSRPKKLVQVKEELKRRKALTLSIFDTLGDSHVDLSEALDSL